MGAFSLKMLKVVAVAVVLLGVTAVSLVVAPVVLGQSLRSRPFTDIRTHLGGSGLGMSLREVDDTDVKREKLQGSTGAIVEDVRTTGPAAKAGFKAGDVIISFDGEKVRSARHLNRLVEETPDGRDVTVVVVRNGEKVTLNVAPEATDISTIVHRALEPLRHLDMSHDLALSIPSRSFSGRDSMSYTFSRRSRLGVGTQDLQGQLAEYFGTRDGVLVTSVDDGTPAKTAGLKAGDVITKINGDAVRDSNDLRRRWAAASGDVTITVIRDRKELTLKAKIESSSRSR